MNYSEQKDELLVTIVLAGDHRAYEGLVLRYEHRVLAAAYAVTRNHHLAEDAAQDAFVTAFMKLNLLRDPTKYGAWVCRIAKNCALNMMARFREYINFDHAEMETYPSAQNIEEEVIASEESEELRESINRLPKNVKQIIHLHYFEGLSVAEIAERLLTPVGTVKWQLSEGRRKLRKELGAMTENENDRLVVKVMKKVEELKLWRLKNNKDGFEAVYEDVLRDVEALPESVDKHRLLSDTLARGIWWITGKENDEILARIKSSALVSKNEEVMEYILAAEENKVPRQGRIDFVKNTHIPFLEQHGFTHCLGMEWFWLGRECFRCGKSEDGFAALDKVLSVLEPNDVYFANALAARSMEEIRLNDLSGLKSSAYQLLALGEEYRYINGELRFWSQPGYSTGNLNSVDYKAMYVIYNAFRCDSRSRIPGASVGDSHTASDGYVLTFEAKGISVETPCGRFDGCELWTGTKDTFVCKTYFKDGIGIVRQELSDNVGYADCVLQSYHIAGGSGILPCHADNRWEYTLATLPSTLQFRLCSTITHADSDTVIFSHHAQYVRYGYDTADWQETMLQLRSEYCYITDDDNHLLTDVRPVIERAKQLAVTPYQKAHTKVACNVMQRILDTDAVFNPNRTHSGHWNFFETFLVSETSPQLTLDNQERRFCFEWKHTGGLGDAGYPLFYNHLLTILHDSLGCIWSEDWLIDHPQTKEGRYAGGRYKAVYCLRKAGTVSTAAGCFKNCLTLELEVTGLSNGFGYRGGKMAYTFAPRIGIVRVVHNYKEDTLQSVYELTAYNGEGEGYMPIFAGMMRHYEAIGLTDGYIASAEYTCEYNDQGVLTLFTDLCGVRELSTADTPPK